MIVRSFRPSRAVAALRRSLRRALRVSLLASLWASLPGDDAGAQSPSQIFFGTGYEFGIPLSIERDRPTGVWCLDCNGTGTSYSHTVLLPIGIRFPALFDPMMGLEARLSLASSSGRFTSLPYTGSAVDQNTGSEVVSVNQVEIDASPKFLGLDILSDWETGSWRLLTGPWFRYRMTGDFTMTERILTPGAEFPSEGRERVIAAGDTLGAAPLSFGLLVGGAYDLATGEEFTFRADVGARIDLNALVSGRNLGAFSLGIGGAFVVNLTKTPERSAIASLPTPPEPEPSVVPEAPGPAALDVEVELFGVADGEEELPYALVEGEKTRRTSGCELLPTIFFEEGSDAIPSRYRRLSVGEAAVFTVDSLARRTPLEVYHHLLNVIGHRMAERENARLTLTVYSRSTSESDGRADSLRRYLAEIWRIDSTRVTVRDGGRPEGEPRVEISASMPEVLEPVTIEWIEQSYRTPTIGLNPYILADAGVKRWSISVRQGTRLIQEKASDTSESSASATSPILVAGETPGAPPLPLVAELTVIDSLDRMKIAVDTLPLRVMEEIASDNGERERAEYLILPTDDSPAALKLRLRRIAESVRDGAVVSIAAAENDRAAVRLTEMITRELRTMLKPRGIEPDISNTAVPGVTIDMELPESTTYGAAVMIVVEQGAV